MHHSSVRPGSAAAAVPAIAAMAGEYSSDKILVERIAAGDKLAMQALAGNNKSRYHLPDGPEQLERDARMAAGGTDWSFKAMGWLFAYDPADAVETGNLGLPPPT